MNTITFETKCYENDWEFILQTPYLDEMVERCNTAFHHKQLIINNVNDLSLVCKNADEKIKKGVIDAYYIAADHAKEALDFFEIEKNSFGKGYYYSIAELVGIYLSKTTYHLHFSSDARMEKKPSNDWILEAITLMDKHPKLVIANPAWNHKFKEAANEAVDETENFYIGYGFSDQCYLIKNELFKKPIYNEYNEASKRYPEYGGELFEKRVDSFMRNHELKRLTHKSVSYIHQNFPKNNLLRQIRKIQLNYKKNK